MSRASWTKHLKPITVRERPAKPVKATRVAKSKLPVPLERVIQKAILAHLSLDKTLKVERCNTGAAMLPGRNGKMMPVRFGEPGSPDLRLVIAPRGLAGFLEVKRPGGKQSDDQRAWEASCVAVGGGYAVVTSVDEALAAVEEMRKR